MTDSTSRRFPWISFSLASLSPSLVRRSSSIVSSLRRTFNFEVFTPQISTFPCTSSSPLAKTYKGSFPLSGEIIREEKWRFCRARRAVKREQSLPAVTE